MAKPLPLHRDPVPASRFSLIEGLVGPGNQHRLFPFMSEDFIETAAIGNARKSIQQAQPLQDPVCRGEFPGHDGQFLPCHSHRKASMGLSKDALYAG